MHLSFILSFVVWTLSIHCYQKISDPYHYILSTDLINCAALCTMTAVALCCEHTVRVPCFKNIILVQESFYEHCITTVTVIGVVGDLKHKESFLSQTRSRRNHTHPSSSDSLSPDWLIDALLLTQTELIDQAEQSSSEAVRLKYLSSAEPEIRGKLTVTLYLGPSRSFRSWFSSLWSATCSIGSSETTWRISTSLSSRSGYGEVGSAAS